MNIEMTPEERKAWEKRKKRCSTCKYMTQMNTATMIQIAAYYQYVACGYMLAKNKKRPCPADDCTAYEPKNGRRMVKPFVFSEKGHR